MEHRHLHRLLLSSVESLQLNHMNIYNKGEQAASGSPQVSQSGSPLLIDVLSNFPLYRLLFTISHTFFLLFSPLPNLMTMTLLFSSLTIIDLIQKCKLIGGEHILAFGEGRRKMPGSFSLFKALVISTVV